MLSTYSSTFDIIRPTRLQTTLELEQSKYEYTPRELCRKLDASRQGGKYKIYQTFPPIFFFSFAKKELKPATSVKMNDFPIHEEEISLEKILPSPHESSVVVAVHINWIGLPCDKVSKLRDLHAKAEFGEAEVRTVLDDVLSCCDVSTHVKVPELAVNKFVVNELQKNKLFSDFVIESQGIGSVDKEEQLCRSSSSREDLLLYHRTRYVHHEGVTGAVFSSPSLNQDDNFADDDDDIIVEGSAGEFIVRNHRPQLIASMEKVAAELACRAARGGKIFSRIVIYGLLVDITTGDTTVGKLIMNFLEAKSTITWSRNSIQLNECLWRLRQVLSSSNA